MAANRYLKISITSICYEQLLCFPFSYMPANYYSMKQRNICIIFFQKLDLQNDFMILAIFWECLYLFD